MENCIQAEDYELWMLIKNGPLIPKVIKEDGKVIIKKPEEFDSEDYQMMEKMLKPRNCSTLASDLMNTPEFPNVSQLRRYGMLYKLHMKAQIR